MIYQSFFNQSIPRTSYSINKKWRQILVEHVMF